MENYNIWELVKNGLFEEACIKADFKYNTTHDISDLRNKLYALFHLRKYDECILLSEKIISLDKGQTDTDFIFLGISLWLSNEEDNAIEAWLKGVNAKYTDAAGGIELQIFIYFFSLRAKDNSLKEQTIKKIFKILKRQKHISYPACLGNYLLNDIKENELLSFASTIPTMKERNLCQINFTIALKKYENEDLVGYYQKLKDSISFGPPSYLEQMYYLAQGELDNYLLK